MQIREIPAAGTHIVGNVGLLRRAEQRNGGVGLRRQHVDEGVGVAVQRDGRRGLEILAVDGAEDPHVVAPAGGGRHDAVVRVDHLHELADLERRRPAPLHLLLHAHLLAPEVPELVLDAVLLDLDELQCALERLEAAVQVVFVAFGGRGGCGGGGGRVGRRRRHREGRGGRGRGDGGCRHRGAEAARVMVALFCIPLPATPQVTRRRDRRRWKQRIS